jgi:hypothetical protein
MQNKEYYMKREKIIVLTIIATILIPLCLCQKIYAQNIMDQYFEGDNLNRTIRSYITNVSNLIPDSTTLQDVWSYVPKNSGFFGVGLSGSVTFLDRRLAAGAVKSSEAFGGTHNDLSKFPTTIPYLPGTAFDLRAGTGRMDVGVSGMWMDDNILANYIGSFLGGSSHFNYRMLGVDFRYVVLKEKSLIPSVTVQAGYYFTWMGFGIEAGKTEKVDVQFRNDTYMIAAQASKDFPFLKPYFGAKVIFSKTDSGFSWETDRPVMVKGTQYSDGASYSSGGKDGDLKAYFQLYGGLGINILFFPHMVTLGGAYNVVTNHFGVNAAVRLIFGD